MPSPQRLPFSIPVASATPTKPLNGRPARDHSSPWRLAWLLAAPHRLGFFAAALMLSGSALWWTSMLVGRALAWTPMWTVSPPTAHSLLKTLGFMPLFFVGFLFTAGPKWLGLLDVEARVLALPVALMLLGWMVTVAGFHTHHVLSAAGLSLVALGWSALCLRFDTMVVRSRAPDRLHATLVAIACSVGALALWGAALGMALGQELWLKSIIQVAL